MATIKFATFTLIVSDDLAVLAGFTLDAEGRATLPKPFFERRFIEAYDDIAMRRVETGRAAHDDAVLVRMIALSEQASHRADERKTAELELDTQRTRLRAASLETAIAGQATAIGAIALEVQSKRVEASQNDLALGKIHEAIHAFNTERAKAAQ